MLAMDARAAQFDHLVSQRLVAGELEFALAVVSEISFRHHSRLQTVCTDPSPGGAVLDDEMVADRVKFIAVVAGRIGRLQPFLQLDIENFKAQTEGGQAVTLAGRAPDTVLSMPQIDEAAAFVVADRCCPGEGDCSQGKAPAHAMRQTA